MMLKNGKRVSNGPASVTALQKPRNFPRLFLSPCLFGNFPLKARVAVLINPKGKNYCPYMLILAKRYACEKFFLLKAGVLVIITSEGFPCYFYTKFCGAGVRPGAEPA
ncbi:hypothetical protein L0337_10875 [candidate division KSB1 bacterium]|nr:hypothetical protein [candidate division KSB1 bacterium]